MRLAIRALPRRNAALHAAAAIPLIVWCASAACAPRVDRVHKKLIEFGWDEPTTQTLRRSWAQMEATTPFDGIVFAVRFFADGKVFNDSSVFSQTAWKREWLSSPLADLKACRFTRFTDNFIRMNADPGTLDWGDDAAWDATASNAAQLAWLAKETGTKGICFDPESYTKPQFQWNTGDGRSFTATEALARKCGGQLMRAMAKEYPRLTLFCLWMFSLDPGMVRGDVASPTLHDNRYGLWPAFVNGLLDGAPRSVKLIDADENAYHADSRARYTDLYNLVKDAKSPLMRLLAPENRSTYRRQVKAGFGFYVDSYINPPGSPWYIGPLPGGTRMERLQENVASALEVSDEYVWIDGEKCRWWDTGGPGRSWEEALPGITAAMTAARAAADGGSAAR